MTVRPADSVPSADVVQRRQGRFRGDIEGLRAIAVLAVVLFHAGFPGLGGGFVGVDVFFVISGFLITGLLWREASTSGTLRLRNFYGARARRLLPASAAVGVVILIASMLLLPPLLARTAMADGIASAIYLGNFWFTAQGVEYMAPFVPPSPFLHYWSLAVEEQFYLVWPVAIIGTAWLLRRTGWANRVYSDRRPYLIVLAVTAVFWFVAALVVMHLAPVAVFYSMPGRAWQLALGGMVALTADRWARATPALAAVAGWLGLALIVASCVLLGPDTLYPGWAALPPTVGAALLIGAGCAVANSGQSGWGADRLLDTAPMRAVGRISYSWYLWHWPVLVLAPYLVGHSLGLAGRLAAALFSVGLAVLTLRYLENPVRFAPRVRSSARTSLILGGVATTSMGLVAALLLVLMPAPVGRGAPAPALAFATPTVPPGAGLAAYDAAVADTFGQVQAAVAASVATRPVPSNLTPPLVDAGVERKQVFWRSCARDAWHVDQPYCTAGDPDSATTVALAGDSHAAMWNAAFRGAAQHRHWRLETLSKASCPLLDLPTRDPQLHREYTECHQWRPAALDRLAELRPRLIVLGLWRDYTTAPGRSAGFNSFDPAWIDSLGRRVRQLRDGGAQVLVLGPVPKPGVVVPICVATHLDDATACSVPRSTAVNEAGIAAERAATEAAGGRYADVTELFCTDQSCPVIVGDTLVYLDANHLTIEYANALAPAMEALAARALAAGR